MKIITIATILMLLLGGGISTVAAQTSLPGDALYPVKTLVEDIEFGLVTNPEIKFQIASKLANNRYEEIQTLLEKGETVPQQAFFEWQMQLYTVLECALQSENPSAKLLMVREMVMQQARQSNQGTLTGEPIPNLYQNTLQSQMKLVDAGIEEPEKLASELDFMFKYVQQKGKDQVESEWEALTLQDETLTEMTSTGEVRTDYQWMYMTGKLDEEDVHDGSNNNHMNAGNQGDNDNGEKNKTAVFYFGWR